ncbi:hypothetical protein ACF0H5_011495 [Mactra antiquata]
MEANSKEMVCKSEKPATSWCWKITKRRLDSKAVLFEDGDIYCKLCSKYIPIHERIDLEVNKLQEFPCGIANCNQIFDTVVKYESHYNSSHRNVCQTCHRTLPSSYLLDIHILETHDSMFTLLAEKQNMYQCLLEDCNVKFKNTTTRRDHMIKIHKYPSNYRYDRSKYKSTPKKNGKNVLGETNSNTSMDVDVTNISQTSSSGRIFSYKVPKNITFGQGVSRGFLGGRGRGRGKQYKKKQHWHNKDHGDDTNTKVEIENVDMTELSDALK